MTTTKTTEQWAKFLADNFDGTEWAAKPAEYYGWCAAGVKETDDEASVLAAWKEQCSEKTA